MNSIYINPEITPYLWSLTKAHAIWVRDVFSRQAIYMDCMPWPRRNIFGIEQPISEFIQFFNPEFAGEMMSGAVNMDIHLLDTMLKDYFEKNHEGFSFPIDVNLITDLEKMNDIVNKLKVRFPHLANV